MIREYAALPDYTIIYEFSIAGLKESVTICTLFYLSLTTIYFYLTLILLLTQLSHNHVLSLTLAPL